jgi:integrase
MKAAGTITKRKLANGKMSWGYSFFAGRDEDGKRLQIKKGGFTTRGEASNALNNAMEAHSARLAAGQPPTASPPPEKTFGQFIREWMDTHAKRTVTPRTLEQYRQSADYMTRLLGEIPLKRITARVLENAVYDLLASGGRDRKGNARPLAPKTVRHAAFVVNGAYETAFRLEEIDANPMRRVKLPKLAKKEPAILSREDISRLLAAAEKTELHAIVVLALASGCRRGELLALRWQDVNLDSGIMTVSASLEQTKGGLRLKSTKSGKPRKVYIPQSAINVLKVHQLQQEQRRHQAKELFGSDYKDTGLVFCRADGDYLRPDRVSSAFCELARKVGLEIGLHTLRHQHASEALSAGAPLPAVSARLGHASTAITGQIYAHGHQDDERRVAEQWEKAFGGLIQGGIPTC